MFTMVVLQFFVKVEEVWRDLYVKSEKHERNADGGSAVVCEFKSDPTGGGNNNLGAKIPLPTAVYGGRKIKDLRCTYCWLSRTSYLGTESLTV